MKSIKTRLTQGLKAVAVVGLFGLVLGSFGLSSPVKVSAETLVSGSIIASPDTIDSGQSTQISWNSFNATHISISQGIGSVSPSGAVTVSPTQTTTYVLTLSNDDGGFNDRGSATVYVRAAQTCQTAGATNIGGPLPCTFPTPQNNAPTVSIYANPTNVISGNSSIVTWSSNNATSCYASNGSNGWSGSRATSGSFNTGGLYSATTYSITCSNNVGSATDSTTVSVNTINNQTCQVYGALNYGGLLPCIFNQVQGNRPTVTIYADRTNIAYNDSTTVRWNTTNANSCYATGGSLGWPGAKSIGPGSFFTGSLTSSRTYSITCSNSYGTATDSVTINVRGLIVTTSNPRPIPTSLVTLTSSVDRTQSIVPTLDNTRPHPGDEINYTVNYQNIGTGAIRNLTLRIDLPYEVDYLFSNPSNPSISGNTLTFNLGTLKANGQGTVSVRVRVRQNIPDGTNLNFPAVLSYVDPAGNPQSVNANVSAQVISADTLNSQNNNQNTVTNNSNVVPLGASAFWAGFLPSSLFGWLVLLILILVLIFLARYAMGAGSNTFRKETTTTTVH